MLIVLEGCDGTGKSTLANSLAKVLGAEIIHCSQYTPNDYNFFTQIIESSKDRHIIADRFMYGQFVYQNEEERPLSEMSKYGYGKSALGNLHMLETQILEAGGRVIHVVAPIEEIQERLQLRGEVVINGLTIEEVVSRFKGTFRHSILPIIEWDTSRYIYE